MCAAVFLALLALGSLLSIAMNRAHRSFCRWRKRKMLPPDTSKQRIRLVGGFIVLMFALATNQWSVSLAAIFIGGLIIAPTWFQLLLAAILRTDGEHAASIARDFIAKMRHSDIDQKWDEDAEDAAGEDDDDHSPRGSGPAAPSSGDTQADQSATTSPHSELVDKVKRIEESFFTILKDRSAYQVEPYSVVKDGVHAYEYDAVIIDEDTGKIRTAVEIKYQKNMNPRRVSELLDRMKPLQSDKYFMLFIIVFESYTQRSLRETLKLREHQLKSRKDIGISLYAFSDGSLEPLNDEDLRRLT
jgi:hypothetical protein